METKTSDQDILDACGEEMVSFTSDVQKMVTNQKLLVTLSPEPVHFAIFEMWKRFNMEIQEIRKETDVRVDQCLAKKMEAILTL